MRFELTLPKGQDVYGIVGFIHIELLAEPGSTYSNPAQYQAMRPGHNASRKGFFI